MTAKMVVVHGIPASGKTTLSRRLAKELPELYLINRDGIKEYLFDTLGIGDDEWSKLLGKASSEAMLTLAQIFLENNKNIMLESAFYKHFAITDIKALNVSVLEIYCRCDESVRRGRYLKRIEIDRHPGHHGKEGDVDTSLYAPLEIGKVTYVDTTAGITESDIEKLKSEVRSFLEN